TCPTRSPRSAGPSTALRRSGSSTTRRTLSRGFSEAVGSWKTIWRSRRWRRSGSSRSAVRSTSAKRTRPAVGSTRRRIRRATVDLPQPDSPTRPRVSPGSRLKETPSTARTALAARPRARSSHAPGPPSGKCLTRPSTASSGMLPLGGVTGDLVIGGGRARRRPVLAADAEHAGAAVGVPAAGRRQEERRDRAGNRLHRHLAVDARDRRDTGQRLYGLRSRPLDPGTLAYYEAVSCMRLLVGTAENRIRPGPGPINSLDASTFGEVLTARFSRLTGLSPGIPPANT